MTEPRIALLGFCGHHLAAHGRTKQSEPQFTLRFVSTLLREVLSYEAVVE
jgi:hypothetical protein